MVSIDAQCRTAPPLAFRPAERERSVREQTAGLDTLFGLALQLQMLLLSCRRSKERRSLECGLQRVAPRAGADLPGSDSIRYITRLFPEARLRTDRARLRERTGD